jgi:2-oxoglutarate ferredoxin oxidoreductase subunit alpha
MEFNVVIGGKAGQGAFSVELELTEMLSGLNYHFFATKNYMSRVRGGHNFHMVRISDHPVYALSGGKWDMVIALDEETESRHRPNLREDGFYLSPTLTANVAKEAQDDFHDVTAANTMLVGVILAVIGAEPGKVRKIAEGSRLKHLMKGFEMAFQWKMAGTHPLAPNAGNHCLFDGNKAIAIGALLGGCQFLAGYPMTPATSIMHYFSSAALSLPVHFEQAEDEIAAINMALGASYGGVRSMTATSGGGFALMQEAVSLAGMTETPIVIVVAQRPGPATGLPTRTEQGDLNFVIHAGHGDFPRIVFAPGSIVEAIKLTRNSFDLADRCQIPVIILTDQYFADSVQVVEDDLHMAVLTRDQANFDLTYQRYALTPDGISPLTCPGLSDALVCVDSDEHNEDGKITEDLNLRIRMMDKRLGKIKLLKQDCVMPTYRGALQADYVVISWGSNRLIVEEAAARLAREGISTASLHFGMVYPLTEDMIAPYGLASKMLVCVENNAEGQFAGLLKRELGFSVSHSVLKYNGECFTVEELYSRIKPLLARG